MTLRISLALSLLAATPAFAQPASKQPAPPAAPKPVPASKPSAAPPAVDGPGSPRAGSAAEGRRGSIDDGGFDKDLDQLFASGGLTSDQAASRAAGASPTVRRRAAEIEVAVAQADAAALARVPVLSGKASYTRLSHIDPFVIPFMGQNFTISSFDNAYLAEAQLVVPLSDYLWKIPRSINAARLSAESSRVNRRTSEVSAGQDARVAYYEWVRAKLQVVISKRQLVQVQKTLEQFRALAEVQRLNKADLLRVEAQEADAEQQVDQLQNLSILREEQLRLLIGAGSEPLAIGEDIRTEIAAPASGQLDELVKGAKEKRLEFKTIDVGIQAKESQRSAEKANLYPKLSAFGIADYADPNQRVFPSEDKFKFTWQVGAQVTWTLNDTLASQTTDRRITAEADELRADRENLERSTRIEVLSAQQAVEIATRTLISSQKGLTAAEESYRVRKELLAADRATAVELVDAETELTRSRIASLNARVDLRVAKAQLDHAVGNDTQAAR